MGKLLKEENRNAHDALLEARNEAFVAYDAASERVATLKACGVRGDVLLVATAERNTARDAFIHAEHQYRHALNALDRHEANTVDAGLPL